MEALGLLVLSRADLFVSGVVTFSKFAADFSHCTVNTAKVKQKTISQIGQVPGSSAAIGARMVSARDTRLQYCIAVLLWSIGKASVSSKHSRKFISMPIIVNNRSMGIMTFV